MCEEVCGWSAGAYGGLGSEDVFGLWVIAFNQEHQPPRTQRNTKETATYLGLLRGSSSTFVVNLACVSPARKSSGQSRRMLRKSQWPEPRAPQCSFPLHSWSILVLP